MSRDGDGKPTNPFATPAPGASNPFEDIMGTAPAAAPNPFGGPAPAPATPAEPETPAITVLRASRSQDGAPASGGGGDDAMGMLGLDIEPHKPPPQQKAVRPELEEWRSEMAHGGVAHSAERPNLASATSSPRIQALSPPKKGGALKTAAIVVVVLVVLAAGAGIGQRLLKGGDSEAAAGAALSETDQLLELGIRPENAPDCFTRDQGFEFSYVDSGGKTVVVRSIADVPLLYRFGAKCLPRR